MTAGALSIEPTEPRGRDEPRDSRVARVRLVPPRLPGPIQRTRRRKEIVLRPARASDAVGCAQVDGHYATTHVWQMDTRQEGDELRISFRQIRLPRELELDAPHRPPTVRSGTLPRGLFWLVAEEVEVGPGGAPAGAPEPAPWSHTLRQTGSASSVQLSLPTQRSAPAYPAADSVRGGSARLPAHVPTGAAPAAGYVIVAATPGAQQGFLRTLVVDRKYRRKGIAGRLLAAALRWAAAQGITELIADVPARNYPALRLLQKAGFTFCGYNDRCYADREVALFFSCRLR